MKNYEIVFKALATAQSVQKDDAKEILSKSIKSENIRELRDFSNALQEKQPTASYSLV